MKRILVAFIGGTVVLVGGDCCRTLCYGRCSAIDVSTHSVPLPQDGAGAAHRLYLEASKTCRSRL